MKEQIEQEKLRLIVFKSALELGNMVDKHLVMKYNLDPEKNTFIVPIKEYFFEDGHLKSEIQQTVRGKDMFFLTDIGNYSIEYKMHGFTNHASPNDLVAQLKDCINAGSRHFDKVNVIMPLLYNGRQHRRNCRESLSCGDALAEFDSIARMKSFITFDAHDQGVEHACRNMEFDNFYASDVILEQFIKERSIDELKNIIFVAPDNGAVGRRSLYLNSFVTPAIHREAGMFVKQRDLNTFIDGKHPILSHDYSGNNDIEGKTAIVIDDMISSGVSIFDVVKELKKRKVGKVYVITTYVLFTKGIDEFDKLHHEGKLDGVYTTNLSYIPEEYKSAEWLHICDCSKEIADIIYNIHNDLSISDILRDRSSSIKLLEKKFNGEIE